MSLDSDTTIMNAQAEAGNDSARTTQDSGFQRSGTAAPMQGHSDIDEL
jgi:hypothetical protein